MLTDGTGTSAFPAIIFVTHVPQLALCETIKEFIDSTNVEVQIITIQI